jgi:hypothetical protein
MSNDTLITDFEDSLIASKVASRFVEAKDFPTEEALKTYLKEHPKADPKNHKVTLIRDYKKPPKAKKPYVPLTHQYPKHKPKPEDKGEAEAEKVAARVRQQAKMEALPRDEVDEVNKHLVAAQEVDRGTRG